MSFKYGHFEGERDGRYYTDLTEEGLKQLLEKIKILRMLDTWTTWGGPANARVKWFNILLRKTDLDSEKDG